MHRPAAARTGAPVAGLRVRLLWHDVAVDAQPAVLDALRVLLVDVPHPMAPTRSMRYAVSSDGLAFTVTEEGDRLGSYQTPATAADAIYVRAHRRAFELASLAGWVRVHAVTADIDGRRVLVVGRSGAGKTTLALQLLAEGLEVQGDESALVRRGESMAVPRPFHVKAGAADLVPALAPAIAAGTSVDDLTVFDPASVAARALTIAEVTDVVLLHRGGPAGVRTAGRGEVLDALAHDAFVVTESRSSLLRTLVGAIGSARCHRLTVGPPSRMVEALRCAIE